MSPSRATANSTTSLRCIFHLLYAHLDYADMLDDLDAQIDLANNLLRLAISAIRKLGLLGLTLAILQNFPMLQFMTQACY